jgi:hypothetical protein
VVAPHALSDAARTVRAYSLEDPVDDTPAPITAPLMVPVPVAAQMLSLDEWSVRSLLRTSQLRGRRVGTRWLVPVAALEEFASGSGPATTQ